MSPIPLSLFLLCTVPVAAHALPTRPPPPLVLPSCLPLAELAKLAPLEVLVLRLPLGEWLTLSAWLLAQRLPGGCPPVPKHFLAQVTP